VSEKIMRQMTSERGMALVSALLLLLVTTMLGVAMFHSFGLLEKISGNTREKQRALHTAESAQTFTEWWLTSNSAINATTGTNCGGVVAVAAATVCSNVLANPASVPWAAGANYVPTGLTVGTAGTVGDYYAAPMFYISFLNTSYNTATGTTSFSYQIDAAGYGGNASSAAVVEGVYNVSVTYTAQDSLTKFINLGGP
jgi:type IV pilus assembly protein PilX